MENLETTNVSTTTVETTGDKKSGLPLVHPGVALAAGVAAAGLLTTRPARAVSPPLRFSDIPGSGDIKVVNYALALEDLETELYVQALQRLTTGGSGGRDAPPGTNITGLRLGNAQRDVKFTRIFAKVEQEHRDLLRATLGNAAIRPFKYDFGMATKSRKEVIDLIYLAERTGTGAYLGAIPSFATKRYLPVAAAIQGTEARHTAIFADVLNDLFGESLNVAPLARDNNGRDRPIPPDTVLASVSPFIIV